MRRDHTSTPTNSKSECCCYTIHSSPGLSLLVSALFRWPCSMSSMPLSPRSVAAGVRPFPLAMLRFYSCVSQVCHWWCPPFSAGHLAFLFMVCHCWCPALFRWPCSISIHGLSLLVSALFRWPCSVSMHLSPRSITAGVRPFPLAHVAFLFICLRPRSEHFCSFVSEVCHFWCLPFFRWRCNISIPQTFCRYVGFLNSFLRCVRPFCHCWCPPISAGHGAFQFVCL